MIRFFGYILLVIMISFGLLLLKEHDSFLDIYYSTYQFHMPLSVAISVFLVVMCIFYILYKLVKTFFLSPRYVRKYFEKRSTKKEITHQQETIKALLEGDSEKAQYFYKKLAHGQDGFYKLLDDIMKLKLLILNEDYQKAETILQNFCKKKETKLIGLYNFFQLSMKKFDFLEAESFASQAYQENPNLLWAKQALFEKALRENNFDLAEKLFDEIEQILPSDVQFSKQRNQRKAVFFIAKAQYFLNRDFSKSQKYIQRAHKFDPTFVPVSLVGAKIFEMAGKKKKAENWLEESWKEMPHKDVATLYLCLNSKNDETKLQRANKLFNLFPNHFESHMLLAKIAIESQNLDLAKKHIEAALKQENNERCYKYLEEIAQKSYDSSNNPIDLEDKVCFQERKKTALSDYYWLADGLILDRWMVFSPFTGKFNAVSYGRLKNPYLSFVEEEKNYVEEKKIDDSTEKTCAEKTEIFSKSSLEDENNRLFFADSVWSDGNEFMSKPMKRFKGYEV